MKYLFLILLFYFSICFGETIVGERLLMLGQLMDIDIDTVTGTSWGEINCTDRNFDFHRQG